MEVKPNAVYVPNTHPQSQAGPSDTAPKFGEVWKRIQSEYGAKAEKPREIKKALDKDDFLKIMVTQMKHQDPTKPFEADKLATEIAQIASVEQLQNVNQALKKLATQNTPLERMAMTHLIGKDITLDRNRFTHAEGGQTSVTYALPEAAAEVTVGIFDEKGELIQSKELGAQSEGPQSFQWNGNKSNTLPAGSGTYLFKVEAKSAQGKNLQISNQHRAHVIGVSYEGTEPVLLVGNNKQQEKVSMKHVIRIEDASPAASTSPSISQVQPAEGPSIPKLKNFVAFEPQSQTKMEKGGETP